MKIGRNDPCWCGSGKKYKRCHLGRSEQEPIRPQEAKETLEKLWRVRLCLHPDSNSGRCSGKIVKAHTVPRKGSLNKISKEGHVYTFKQNFGAYLAKASPSRVGKIGVGDASTFTGFCGLHDKSLFSPLEDRPFLGSREQCFLLAYRSLCRELYAKRAQYSLREFYEKLDSGKDFFDQRAIQDFISSHFSGVTKGLADIEQLKTIFDKALLAADYSEVGFYIIDYSRPLDIMGTGGIYPECDFNGRSLFNFARKHTMPTYLSFSLIATDYGGAIVFSWLGDPDGYCASFADSINHITDHEVSHACVRFAFEFIENLFFSPNWWDRLDNLTQSKLTKRMIDSFSPFYLRQPNCLIDDGVRAVQWELKRRRSSLIPMTLN